MNWLDIVLIVALLFSLATSFAKGFSREAIMLVAAITGFAAGSWYYRPLAAHLEPYVSARPLADFAAFMILFLGVVIAGAIVASLIARALRTTGLSGLDRMLGAVFGVLRWAVLSGVLLMAYVGFSPQRGAKPPEAIVESRIAPYLLMTAGAFAAMAPQELKDGFRKHYAELKHLWEKAVKEQPRELPRTEL